MIDVHAASLLVQKHRSLADTRRTAFAELHAMYACNQWNTTDTNAGLFGGAESVEDGSLYGIIDTKVAATTPLRPRIAVTPDILEDEDDEEVNEQDPQAVQMKLERLAVLATENRRRARFAANRQRYLHYLFDEGDLHLTLHRLNALARVVPHAFLRADWSPRLNRPVLRAFSPLEVWLDEAADCWEDVEYIIHATFPRKHEVERRVQAGLYEQDLVRRITYAPRPEWSRLFRDAYQPDTFIDCVPIYEVHDLLNGRVMHLADACGEDPLLEQDQPLYAFQENPFHYLSFVEYLTGLRGLADAEILQGPSQRLSRLAAIEYFSGKAGVPDYILNTNAVDDVKAAQEQWNKPRRPGSTLQVGLRQGVKPEELVGITPTPNVQPALSGPKQTAQQDLAFRAGVPNYQRGEPEPRVAATYGALQQQAEATRRGWDIRLMQKCVVWWAGAAVALAEEFMPEHQVVTFREQDPTGRATKTAKVYRAKMDFRDPAEWAHAASIGTEPPEARSYFYTMEPFEDPMTKNPQAELAMDMQMLEGAATGAVPIDPMYLAERIRQNRGYGPEFIKRDWQPPAAAPAPGSSPAGAPTDTPEGGGMPPGVVPVPTPAQGAMLGGAGAPAPVPMGAGAPESPFPM